MLSLGVVWVAALLFPGRAPLCAGDTTPRLAACARRFAVGCWLEFDVLPQGGQGPSRSVYGFFLSARRGSGQCSAGSYATHEQGTSAAGARGPGCQGQIT